MAEVPSHLTLSEFIREGTTNSDDEEPAELENDITDDIEKALTDEQIAELKDAFALFDKDGDGTISSSELGSVMNSIGLDPTEEELKNLVTEMDFDGNGEIDFEEFIQTMASQLRGGDSDRRIAEAFKVFDRTGNGYVSADELRDVMTTLGEPLTDDDVDDMMRELNVGADGLVSCARFLEVLKMN